MHIAFIFCKCDGIKFTNFTIPTANAKSRLYTQMDKIIR